MENKNSSGRTKNSLGRIKDCRITMYILQSWEDILSTVTFKRKNKFDKQIKVWIIEINSKNR